MKAYKKNNGFTLVELMIAMVSAAVLAMVIAMFLFMAYRSWRTDNEYARLRRDVAFAVRIMAKEIRSASYNGITASNNSLQLQTNAVRPNLTLFTRNAASSNLTFSFNGNLQGSLINKGLKTFNPLKQTNGVLLQLEMVNSDGTLSITNRTFIFARN